jgi:small subunit ribosomal protein S13
LCALLLDLHQLFQKLYKPPPNSNGISPSSRVEDLKTDSINMAEQKFRHIVRVANVDLPGGKVIGVSLQKIKGVGTSFSAAVCNISQIPKSTVTGNLTDEQVALLTDVLTKPREHGMPTWFFNRQKDYETATNQHLLTGTLVFVKDNDLKRLKKTKTLRGMRHQKRLPVRGQRTRSNFRHNKGKVVGVKKKGAPQGKK